MVRHPARDPGGRGREWQAAVRACTSNVRPAWSEHLQGKAQRVMPGMAGLAFVDVGLDRAAFLHANDVVRAGAEHQWRGGGSAPLPTSTPIVDADIVVQVVKDLISSKGARLTTQISIPSRYMVLPPAIESDRRVRADRGRGRTPAPEDARDPAATLRPHGLDRAHATPRASRRKRWPKTSPPWRGYGHWWSSAAATLNGGRLRLRRPRPRPARVTRTRRDVEKVKVDSRETCDRLQLRREIHAGIGRTHRTLLGRAPDLRPVRRGRRNRTRAEKERGSKSRPEPKAMTTIDVNTGSFLGQRNLEET